VGVVVEIDGVPSNCVVVVFQVMLPPNEKTLVWANSTQIPPLGRKTR